jgi:hypothetical protein
MDAVVHSRDALLKESLLLKMSLFNQEELMLEKQLICQSEGERCFLAV